MAPPCNPDVDEVNPQEVNVTGTDDVPDDLTDTPTAPPVVPEVDDVNDVDSTDKDPPTMLIALMAPPFPVEALEPWNVFPRMLYTVPLDANRATAPPFSWLVDVKKVTVSRVNDDCWPISQTAPPSLPALEEVNDVDLINAAAELSE